jgi:hypothetical protein
MQMLGCKRPLDDTMQYRHNTFVGSISAPPITLNGAALLTHDAPQPMQLGHSPVEPAPAVAQPQPAPSQPVTSPLDTAEVMFMPRSFDGHHIRSRPACSGAFLSVH